MALPKIDLPRFKHKLYGLKKTISYRAFTVKEQKILLHAKEDEQNIQGFIDAVKQVVELCTFNEIDVDKLPMCDLEDLFIRIRGKSVGDSIEMRYRVKDLDGKPTKEEINFDIKIDDIVVSPLEGHTDIVKINDELGLKMRYPTFEMILNSSSDGDEDLIINCIESVYTADEVYVFADETEEVRRDYLESFGSDTLLDIKKFFDTMPRARYEKEIALQDGTTRKMQYEGLEDFF